MKVHRISVAKLSFQERKQCSNLTYKPNLSSTTEYVQILSEYSPEPKDDRLWCPFLPGVPMMFRKESRITLQASEGEQFFGDCFHITSCSFSYFLVMADSMFDRKIWRYKVNLSGKRMMNSY